MTKVDLITGFLGAGKTTFIHRYLYHISDQKVLIIENEFGSIGVDARLLRNEGCPIEDLSGVCMCCRGRDQFIHMLIDAAAHGFDRVLVEPSGIYDVDEFFSVMNEAAVRNCCEIGSILAIVDAHLPQSISDDSAYLMVTQLLASGAVILSRTQDVSSEEIKQTIDWLNDLIRLNGGTRVLSEEVCVKPWTELTDEDFIFFMQSGYHHDAHKRRAFNHEGSYGSFMTAGYCVDEADLKVRLSSLFENKEYGDVIRTKGFIRDLEKNFYEVNCTARDVDIKAVTDIRRGILVIIGQNLNEAALNDLFLPAVSLKR